MNNLVGQSLGRYHILELLGEGGMASVYKAFDTRLERNVAIKVIRTEKGQDEQFLRRFEREAKALARLSHPNIVHVNDYGEQDGIPFVVMDFLPGGTLKEKMGQAMPYKDAARLLAPIARALEFAHHMHIVHRDIKPANILLTQNGLPMLSDFGIAKILEEGQLTELTGTGVRIGTPEYMAPEQGQGIKVDYRADIYALGVVFYELVTGRKPFRADTPMAVILKHMTEPLKRPREFVPDLPESVEKILFKSMAKKPEDRYQDMGAFAAALDKLSLEEEIKAQSNQISIAGAIVPKSTAMIGGLSIVGGLIILAGILVVCLLLYFLEPWKKSAGGGTTTQTAAAAGSILQSTQVNQPGSSKPPVLGKAAATPTIAGEMVAAPPLPVETGGAAVVPEPAAADTVGGPDTSSSEDEGYGGKIKIFINESGTIQQGQTINFEPLDLPSGYEMLIFSASWQTEGMALILVITDPDGRTVEKSYPDAMTIESPESYMVNIQSPTAGIWNVSLYGNTVPAGNDVYNISVMSPTVQ